MPIPFQLTERMAGFALAAAQPGDRVPIQYSELVGPDAGAHLNDRLTGLQEGIIGHIPGLPKPPLVQDLLVVIHSDLSGVAYADELRISARVKVNRDILAGEAVMVDDVAEVSAIDLGVEVPEDSAVIVVRSFGWRRSLYYDLGPLSPEPIRRSQPLEAVLAQQQLLLLGIPSSYAGWNGKTRFEYMQGGHERLLRLLERRCGIEAKYQELLVEHPWMLGGEYSGVERHTTLDDKNVPDFTAIRSYDGARDVLELKHPFLPLFRKDKKFNSEFNDAWNQAERYVGFSDAQRSYLLEEKNLRFSNTKCLLILGHGLTTGQLHAIRTKERLSTRIFLITYDDLLARSGHMLNLVRTAGQLVAEVPAG